MAITISGNNISNNGKDGIRIEGELELVIDENTIAHNGGQGINIREIDQNIDPETMVLLNELKTALNNKDASTTKKVFGVIADKSFDVAVAVIAGLVFK